MIGYLDCSSGVSGDMFLGALFDLGFEPGEVVTACAAVGLEIDIVVRRVTRSGLAATSVQIESEDTTWRTWSSIRSRLEQAPLDAAVRDNALRAFALLAHAEARVHGVAPDDVHFHEVGAADTVADLLGVAVGLGRLGIERLICSPISLGGGHVNTQHGRLSVPAPATVELLSGVPASGGPVDAELATPTGAALVRAHATAYGFVPPMVPQTTGRGAGSREFEGVPNVVTLTLGEAYPADDVEESLPLEPVVELTTAVDHISPEHAAFATKRLLDAGALDVWQRPLSMKKGRLGIELTVLCAPADETRLAGRIVEETESLGVRVRRLERYVAARSNHTIETELGDVRVKQGPGGARVEHDDVARIALETGRPYGEVLRDLLGDR